MALAALPAWPACTADSGKQQRPLVELFTSEGCSSCPPADAWLGRQDAGAVSLLAWHVDYWDNLGWPDRLARPAHANRQRLRVEVAGERTLYTPEFLVNGQPGFDAARALQRPHPAAMSLALSAEPKQQAGWTVRLTATPAATDPRVIYWLAVTASPQTHAVGAGENSGRTLTHYHAVIAHLPLTPGQPVWLPRPPGVASARLVAWAERQDAPVVLQSVSLPVAACGPA